MLNYNLVVKIHKMYKVDILNNLHCFDRRLTMSRLGSFQLLVSAFLCYTLINDHLIFYRVF